MPATPGLCPLEFAELITSCWHADPTVRPTFLEIMTRLPAMHTGADLTSGVTTSLTSKTSTISPFSSVPPGVLTSRASSRDASWSLPSTNDSSSASVSSASKDLESAQMATGGDAVRPPRGDIAVVFTDITRAASLWEFNAGAMRDATLLHNETLRAVMKRQNRGYEVVFAGDRSGCSGEGFCMAFQHASDALAWCCGAQLALLGVAWPEELLAHPGAAEEWGDTDDRYAASSHDTHTRHTTLTRERVQGGAQGPAGEDGGRLRPGAGGARSDNGARGVQRPRGRHGRAHHDHGPRRPDRHEPRRLRTATRHPRCSSRASHQPFA
jgi:hypothetical protein